MSIKVDSVMQKDVVTLLSDVDIEYVSLVKHGANRTPIKILKSDVTASDVAKEIIDLLKSLVDEQAKESSDASADTDTDSGDLPENTTGSVDKLKESVASQHKALLDLKDQLDKISPSDLDSISDEHLDDLKKTLQALQETYKSTVKYEEDQPRADNGQWTSGGGSSSSSSSSSQSKSTADTIHSKVTSAVQSTHKHAATVGKISQKVSTIAAAASTALHVIAPAIPHAGIKAGVMLAAKVAMGVAVAAEGVTLAAHSVERELKPHVDDSVKPQNDESATKHWDKKALSSIDTEASKLGLSYMGVNDDGSLLYHNKETDDLVNVTKDRSGKHKFNNLSAKSESGEGDMSLEVIHSIIQPTGKDINALKDLYPEWFKNVKLSQKIEDAEKVVFVQKGDDSFDESAFRFLDAGYGLEFKVGKLKRTEKSDDSLLIPTQITSSQIASFETLTPDVPLEPVASANLDPTPMDTLIVEQSPDGTAASYPVPDMNFPDGTEKFSFGEMFQSKLNAFASAVVAAMELSEDPLTRKRVIQTFWKSFGNFLNAALDRVDANSMKAEGDQSTPQSADAPKKDTDTGGFDMAELFATKEELTQFIKDTVKAAMKESEAPPKEQPKEPDETAKSEPDVDHLAELNKKLDGIAVSLKEFDTIKAEVKTLTEKTESLEHGTGPRRSWSEDVQANSVTLKSEFHPMKGVFSSL